MRYLGLDLGTRTLGISMSDPMGKIASTYQTIRFSEGDYESLLPVLQQIVTENKVMKIVLGFPKNMNNSVGDRALTTLKFKEMLENALNIEVILQDERRSTIEATYYMVQADVSRKKRKKKVDSLAANIILQTYLDKMEER